MFPALGSFVVEEYWIGGEIFLSRLWLRCLVGMS